MKNLKLLLIIHAIVTFAAAAVRIIIPPWSPSMVNIELRHNQ